MKGFKQFGLLLVVGLVGMSAGIAIMWGVRGINAAGESGHSCALVYHQGTNATCESAGTRDYWECPEHHTYYSDALGLIEISITDIEIPALKHVTIHYEDVPATCQHAGHVEYYHCKLCGKDFAEATCINELTSVVRPQKAHTRGVFVSAQDATCTTDGCHEHYQCVYCETPLHADGTLYPDAIIKAHHHSDQTQFVAYQPATCTAEGHGAYYKCLDCDEKFADVNCTEPYEVIPQLIHQSEDTVALHIHEKAKTCLEDGNPEYWICKNCGEKFADQKCKTPLAADAFDAYHAVGHHVGYFDYAPEHENIKPCRYYDSNHNLITVNAKYYPVCEECHEICGPSQSVNSFAELVANAFNNNTHNITLSYEADAEGKVADVYAINRTVLINESVVIKFELPGNYGTHSQCRHSVTDEPTNVIVTQGKLELNVQFTQPGSLVWQFDWDGDGIYEQTIKFVLQ